MRSGSRSFAMRSAILSSSSRFSCSVRLLSSTSCAVAASARCIQLIAASESSSGGAPRRCLSDCLATSSRILEGSPRSRSPPPQRGPCYWLRPGVAATDELGAHSHRSHEFVVREERRLSRVAVSAARDDVVDGVSARVVLAIKPAAPRPQFAAAVRALLADTKGEHLLDREIDADATFVRGLLEAEQVSRRQT
jgi:hypothetical protein